MSDREPFFTEEHDMIRQTVKRFCLEEIEPHAEEWDHAGIFPRELGSCGGIRFPSKVPPGVCWPIFWCST